MSLILDALNKADRDEALEGKDIPDITSTHDAPIEAETTFKQYFGADTPKSVVWLVGIVILLLVFVSGLLIALLFLRGDQEASVVNQAAVAEVVVPVVTDDVKVDQIDASVKVNALPENIPPQIIAPENTPTQNVAFKNTASEIAPSTESPMEVGADENGLSEQYEHEQYPVNHNIQALYDDASQLPVDQVKGKAIEQKGVPEAANADQALAQALWEASRRQSHTPLPAAAQQQEIIVTPKAKVEVMEEPKVDAPVEDTLAAVDDIPFLHELSVSHQNLIPTLMYSDHQYVNGYVIFNQETIQAGEVSKGGVKVERVLADGVVLNFKEHTFKLSSLSSWVNY